MHTKCHLKKIGTLLEILLKKTQTILQKNIIKKYKEKELVEFCKQYYPDLIENDRQLSKPYELDIVIPELKLAIEFNSTYWHSEQAGKDKNYHLNKTIECEKQRI